MSGLCRITGPHMLHPALARLMAELIAWIDASGLLTGQNDKFPHKSYITEIYQFAP
jgi:hypothetical protein